MPASAPKAEQAREVLGWCLHLLQELRQQPTGMDWIVKWAAALTFIRTVGEALKNVDAQKYPAIGKARQRWKQSVNLSDQPIYKSFITGDSNALLHHARVNAGQSAMVFLRGVSATGRVSGEDIPQSRAEVHPPPPVYKYHMDGGPFNGRDPRDIFQEAIAWWEQQIGVIETDAAPG
jgi:hypothetical protein